MDFGLDTVLLFGAAMLAGGINVVAGGGGLLIFPALLLVGVPPLSANATSAAGIWIGLITSSVAYRRELKSVAGYLWPVTLASLGGGALGAWLVLHFSNEGFTAMVPYLVAIATLLFAFSPGLTRLAEQWRGNTDSGRLPFNQPMLIAGQGIISIYGGFFGGGAGILILTLLTLTNPAKIQVLQAIKIWVSICISTAAIVYFLFVDIISWPHVVLLAVATSLGGYSSAFVTQHVSAIWVRRWVIGIGSGLTLYFFMVA